MGLPFENADYNEDEVGARKIPELTDVVLTNIQDNNVLVYNNGIWENQAQTSGITELTDIPGVTITSVQANQVLKYVNGVWVNSTDTDANTDNLNDLTDTLLTTPFGDDEVIKYLNGKWVNGNIPIEKLSNVYISNLQDGETLRYVHQNSRWENAYNIDTLNELSDVTISSNLNNHVLKYNNQLGVYKNAYLNVSDLGDTNITTIANGNTLIYNNGEWSAGNIPLSNFTNGTGISVTGTSPNFTITNTAPDETVILNNGTGISVTGTYPEFTITNTYQETDPVFTAHVANGITSTLIGRWNSAWGWGDHSTQTYIKNIAPLHIDTTNNRVGINVASPNVNFEVHNTMYVNSDTRKVGILNATPSTTFQVGYLFNVNLTTDRVGIGTTTPRAKLDVDSVIQITAETTTKASLYFSKVVSPEVSQDLAEITSQSSGTNGGDIQFWTANSGGGKTQKITINDKGAIGIGATPDYGTTGQVLTSNESGSAVSWTTPSGGSSLAVYANSYLSGTYQDQSTPSTSTFYRVGHTTTFTAGAVSGTGIVNTSGEHKLTIPLGQGGVYKVDATIVMEIMDSQGAVEWEGRMMRNVSGTITEIAYAQRHYTDYPFDGVSASALTWKNTIHLHKTLTLNEGDFIYLEQRNSGGNKTRYYGSSTGSRTNFSIVKVDAPALPSGAPTSTAVYGGAKITQNSISGTADLTGYYYLIYQGLQFVSTTKKVFVATYDGWYNLSWSMDARTAGTAYNFRFMYLNVYKNGVKYHETIFADDLGVSADKLQGVTNGGSVIIQLLATDYISFEVSSDSTNYGITGYTSLNKIDTTAPAPTLLDGSISPTFNNITANVIDGGISNVNIKLNDTTQGGRLKFSGGHSSIYYTIRNDEFNCWDGGSSQGMFLNYNGASVYYGNPPSALSDDRIKFNETNITNALKVIRKLSPERYTKRLPTQTIGVEEAGFIAQEVMAIPELKFAVTHPNKEITPGDPNTRYYTLTYDSIFTYAVAGLKELDTIVQAQAQLIKALEARLKILESK